jgi:processive 1,2-diacylglycerol beta-glucosyltransferase
MSEATAMRMPIVMIAPLPGQEERNAEFLLKAGAAVQARGETELRNVLGAILADPRRLDELSGASRKVGRPGASRQIAKMALQLAHREVFPRELVVSQRHAG